MKFYKILILCIAVLSGYNSMAQKAVQPADSVIKTALKTDTAIIIKPKHNHRLATKRSAIIPGWGQAYNKEYWKIPVVYGALSIPTITFFYNNTWYKRTREAYDLLYKASSPGATPDDTANLKNIHEKLQGFSLSSLQTFRNSFRKDRDYSVLWFVIVWGLNVVDATVFGHLKDFDVSDNLSMHINPSINPMNNSKGLSLVFSIKKPAQKLLVVR